jgi:hypothetical protein
MRTHSACRANKSAHVLMQLDSVRLGAMCLGRAVAPYVALLDGWRLTSTHVQAVPWSARSVSLKKTASKSEFAQAMAKSCEGAE